jgi:hypothetical protein
MKVSVFWDITPCSTLKVNRSFGGKYRFHLRARRINQARNGHKEQEWDALYCLWLRGSAQFQLSSNRGASSSVLRSLLEHGCDTDFGRGTTAHMTRLRAVKEEYYNRLSPTHGQTVAEGVGFHFSALLFALNALTWRTSAASSGETVTMNRPSSVWGKEGPSCKASQFD